MRRLGIAVLLVLVAVAALLWRDVAERRAAARASSFERDAAPVGLVEAADEAPLGQPPEDGNDELRVQVLDATTGRPIAGATVEGDSVSETTDARGFASLTVDLSGAGVPVRAYALGFVPDEYWFDESDSDPWIPLRPGIPVAGRVVHADGEPAVRAEAAIKIPPDVRVPLRLDAMGRFEIPGLPEGEEVRVRAGEEGYWPVEVDFTAGPGSTMIEIVLGRGGACEGVVIDDERRPVADARVRVERGLADDAQGRADREGRFTIRGLPVYVGYRAHADTPDRRYGMTGRFSVGADGPPHRCEIVVRPTAYVVLRFEYPDGSPVTGAVVKFGENHLFEPRAPGEYWSGPLWSGGPHVVRATAGGWDTREIAIDVKPDVRNDATLRLEERKSLEGFVVDVEGAPVRRVPVFFAGASTWTGEDGAFLLRGLKDEAITVRVHADGFEDASVEARPGRSPIRVVLERAPRVVGRIEPPPPLRAVDVTFGDGNLMYDAGALADREGRFEAFAPAGKCWLRIEVEGSVPWVFPALVLAPGQTLDLGLLKAHDGATIRGVVVDQGGAPVAEADVRAYCATTDVDYDTTSTDGEGRFSISRVADTPLTVYVEREGYVTKAIPILQPGAAQPLKVVLEPGGVLEVTGAEAEIAIEPVGGGERFTLGPDDEGFLTLPPGRYRVAGRIVEIRVGETTVVELGE